jgi:transketolase
LIACRTMIGFGAPNRQGSEKAHGAPLGADEVTKTRAALDWAYEPVRARTFRLRSREAFVRYIELRKTQPLFSNARSIRNALDRMPLRQASRLVADLDRVLAADNVMSLEASDVLASRVFSV